MAIDPSAEYPGQIDTTDPTGYPRGKAQNVLVAGDGQGTPLEEKWLNDWFGFVQALLDLDGVVPSGTSEKVGASQLLTALENRYRTEAQVDAAITAAIAAITDNYHMNGPILDQSEFSTFSTNSPRSGVISVDGTKIFTTSLSQINEHTLAVPFAHRSIQYEDTRSISAQTTLAEDIFLKPDGASVWVMGFSTFFTVYEYSMSTPFDVTTLAFVRSYNDGGVRMNAQTLCFSNDGNHLFVCDRSDPNFFINRFDMSTPWRIDTASANLGQNYNLRVGLGVSYQSVTNSRIWLSTDGLHLFVNQSENDDEILHRLDMSTPWDLTTISVPFKSRDVFQEIEIDPGNESVEKVFFSAGGDYGYYIASLSGQRGIYGFDATVRGNRS